MEELETAQIVFDNELQVRYETNEEVAREYYEAMATEEDVKKFPPPTVYFDGCRYWLADGRHRYLAAYRRGYQKMLVKVLEGSHDDAILAAVKLNTQHGLRFNDDDWEKIISLIAGKEQWSDWSNRRLAEELGCCDATIRKYRPTESGACEHAPEKRRGKDGKMYPSKTNKKQKPKTASVESPSVTVTPNEPSRSETAPSNDTPLVNEVVTPPPDAAQHPTSDNAFTEANAGKERIFETLAVLEQQINEWFDLAPPELHEEFDNQLRQRITAMID
jgi:hypothetical protein